MARLFSLQRNLELSSNFAILSSLSFVFLAERATSSCCALLFFNIDWLIIFLYYYRLIDYFVFVFLLARATSSSCALLLLFFNIDWIFLFIIIDWFFFLARMTLSSCAWTARAPPSETPVTRTATGAWCPLMLSSPPRQSRGRAANCSRSQFYFCLFINPFMPTVLQHLRSERRSLSDSKCWNGGHEWVKHINQA